MTHDALISTIQLSRTVPVRIRFGRAVVACITVNPGRSAVFRIGADHDGVCRSLVCDQEPRIFRGVACY